MPRKNSSLVSGPPLTPAVFHILLALVDGDKHGYAIMKDVEHQAASLIEELDERPDPELDNERRRYYRLTALGRKLAREENQRLMQAVKSARLKRLSDDPLN